MCRLCAIFFRFSKKSLRIPKKFPFSSCKAEGNVLYYTLYECFSKTRFFTLKIPYIKKGDQLCIGQKRSLRE